MKIGKGDIRAQRRRRKARYRGCAVCGDPSAKLCADCRAIEAVLAAEWPPILSLFVDGGFVTQSGERDAEEPGHGGAGLVLATSVGKILAARACAFPADSSSDAEFQAVIRGARWAPGAVIYTDSESTCWAAISSNGNLDVRFLRDHERGPLHAMAHQLSVEGRLRQAIRSSQVVRDEGDHTALSTAAAAGEASAVAGLPVAAVATLALDDAGARDRRS